MKVFGLYYVIIIFFGGGYGLLSLARWTTIGRLYIAS
jgi:hypothetical protein